MSFYQISGRSSDADHTLHGDHQRVMIYASLRSFGVP